MQAHAHCFARTLACAREAWPPRGRVIALGACGLAGGMQAHTRLPAARACIALREQAGTLRPMPGRPKDHNRFRLASGRQLWRLNELGRLHVVDDGAPISSNEAKVLIAVEFNGTPGNRGPVSELSRHSGAPHQDGPRGG
jgi:hypothetical protein